MKYLYKLYIGTEDNSQSKVVESLSKFFDNFTIYKGIGCWIDNSGKSIRINTYIVEIISSEDEFSMDKVAELESLLGQEKILTTKYKVKVLVSE